MVIHLLGSLLLLLRLWLGNASILSATAEFSLPSYATYLAPYQPCAGSGYGYFDSSSQTCASCSLPYVSSTDTNLYGDPTSCVCSSNYKQSSNDCSSDTSGTCVGFSCTSCTALTQVASEDQTLCVSCNSSTTLGIGTDNDCKCSDNNLYRLNEYDLSGNRLSTKNCVACASGSAVVTTDKWIAGKYYIGSRYLCQECPDSHMSMSVTVSGGSINHACSCTTGYTLVGVSSIAEQSCVKSSYVSSFVSVQQTAQNIAYLSGTVQSWTILHYFASSAGRCSYFGGSQDIAACQALANLCVLQLYDDSTLVCSSYYALLSARSQTFVNNIQNWPENLPWLLYDTSSTTAVCQDTSLRTSNSLGSNSIEYVLGMYYLNGSFAGYRKLGTDFSYCAMSAPNSQDGGGESASSTWMYFGTSRKYHFNCDLSTLLFQEQLFYEMFVVDSSTGEYYPVPVRIVGMTYGGSTHNTLIPTTLQCDSSDVLVRRFFLFDVVGGLTSSSLTLNSGTSQQRSLPEVIRYATTMRLSINLASTSGNGQIYPPILSIEYTDTLTSSFLSTSASTSTVSSTSTSIPYVFQVSYGMDMTSYFSTLLGFMGAALALVLLLVVVRYYNWSKRTSRVIISSKLSTDLGVINLEIFRQIFYFLIQSWVEIFFPLMLLVCWFYFVVFKLQTVPAYMLPPMDNIFTTSSPYFPFVANLYLCTIFQIINIIRLVHRQCQTDIFFLDWEPAPTLSAKDAGSNSSTTNNNNNNNNVSSNNNSSSSSSNSISVWRTLFVGNQWLHLQTHRRTDIRFTLFFLALILIGLNFQDDALQQPSLHSSSSSSSSSSEYQRSNVNIVLRFAESTFWWLVLSWGQYLFQYLFYERWIGELPEQQFIDVCTLAKISVFVVDEKFHGYYLHCRSPHPHADCPMTELVELLHREESGLTADRSLEGVPADVQSVELYFSSDWRIYFDTILQRLDPPNPSFASNTTTSRMSHGGVEMTNWEGRRRPLGQTSNTTFFGGTNFSRLPTESVVWAWREMTLFLREFVENNLAKSSLKRIVRELSYWDSLFHFPPDVSQPESPTVMITDRRFTFTSVLFLGQELPLLLFNILTYSLFDFWFNSVAIAICLCYVVDLGLCYVRFHVGKRQISKKTLVDDRFLI